MTTAAESIAKYGVRPGSGNGRSDVGLLLKRGVDDLNALRRLLQAHGKPCPNFWAVAVLGATDERVAAAGKKLGAVRDKWGFWRMRS